MFPRVYAGSGPPTLTRMLELWTPDDAFARIEAYLRDSGFFGGSARDIVADLYLGYGLSRALRREAWPDPPEPCHLPFAACLIRPANAPPPSGDPAAVSVGTWRRSWDDAGYAHAIGAARAAIAAGDVYQVNLVQHLSAPFVGDPAGLATALGSLAPRHPRPMTGDGWAIVSASPELFLAREGDRLWTMPIKGTRPAGWSGDALRSSAKDAAEHVMIVDLERNDLGRVCLPGTVRWPELMVPRQMAGVVHLVSVVEGRIRPGVGFAELLTALFPGGSVTGAPKIAAIDRIAALEPVGRGASMGALGTVYPNGDLDLSLTIRTFAVADGRVHLWVGGGIVWDSDPAAEIEESWVKARPLLDAIGAPLGEVLRE
jgi:para-aminobenzoate synthetase component I